MMTRKLDDQENLCAGCDYMVNTFHPMHCGGACMLKLHMKDGDVSKVTSAGDIPRQGSYEHDESLVPMQRRACLLGLSEKRRIYAPDRLKYPLMQTKQRGDISGFKRISWEQALDTVAGWYKQMIVRKDSLGYLPIWDEGGLAPYLGTYLKRFGNPSAGNVQAAMYGAIGDYYNVIGNPVLDMLNARYIVVWANDNVAAFPVSSFIMMKAKEAGIPITVVDCRYTDTASTMATGEGEVPRHLCVRPGTDGALMAAMCNVIYRKNLHDEKFIKQHCFGFYKNDTVVSRSKKRHPITNEPYKGQTFTVPQGLSFVEYLDELQEEHGGYEGVLNWAQKLTGVSSVDIENFAIHYATADPTFLFTRYTGAQRTNNGMYFSWMLIALSAMTGNINKRGGGFGEVSMSDGYKIEMQNPREHSRAKEYEPILFSGFRHSDVLLSGSDGRTKAQLRDDVMQMNGIDLGEDAQLCLEMYVRGAVGGDVMNSTQNVNKSKIAWKRFKHVVSYERFLTSTASWSDIVLPTVANFEESYFNSQVVSDSFVVNGPIEPMYEAKPDEWINEQIAKRLDIDYVRKRKPGKKAMKKQWEKAKVPKEYLQINPKFKKPEFDELVEAGSLQLPVPPEKSLIHTAKIRQGEFDTDTGRINFYSPYFAQRGRAVLKSPRVRYVPLKGGYEHVLENGGVVGAKNIKYMLQFITPHVRQRALSTYGNMPVVQEQHVHAVEISEVDADTRDIADGDIVYVFTDFGCIKLPAKLTKRIMPGVVSIGQGMWYRASKSETYEVWLDIKGEGNPEKHVVPVDIGGCVNTISKDRNCGILDPFFEGMGLNAGGELCEISKDKPI